MYAKLVEAYQTGTVSFKYVQTFNMDEYVNLAEDHPESYHTFMMQHLFSVSRTCVIKFSATTRDEPANPT